MENLRKAGERLGKYELEKKYAIALEDYDKAKAKKAQAQQYRQQVYQSLEVQDLLEPHGVNILPKRKCVLLETSHPRTFCISVYINSRWRRITCHRWKGRNQFR